MLNLTSLDILYSPSKWSNRLKPDIIVKEHMKILLDVTASTKLLFKSRLSFDNTYSHGLHAKYDVYFPLKENVSPLSPILIYLHGGYWTMLSKEYSGFFAETITQMGVIFIAVGYELAPRATMTTIIENIRCAILSISSRFPKRSLFLAGHSAGAHLAALMIHTDWRIYGYLSSPINGFILISGIYNLVPIIQTYVNYPLELTLQSAIQHSPIFQKFQSVSKYDILILVAESDSPAFHKQAKDYYSYLEHSINNSVFLKIPQTDHFNIIELLISDEYCFAKLLNNFVNNQCLKKEFLLFI